ncbi:hypothetical protein BDA99DRAFT_531237 [Phascolomyces articulosus]|uniref:AMP-binding enzyme C-terminal domain-containing protein n=1 Tax=Phascolomyces articulosus TaxID=60185 RepID=A0AAD5KQ96_9FUNG|nr:hypothetical protein BDA99DRAFT_531237 [Phascolomyces articulosus]
MIKTHLTILYVVHAELEALLLKNPNVNDYAIIGVYYDQEQFTEIPRAFVVLKRDVNHIIKTVDALKKFVADNVSTYKQIRSAVSHDAIQRVPQGRYFVIFCVMK